MFCFIPHAHFQTGSGKTYTMEGPIYPDEQTQGMIPRALTQVFDAAQQLSDKGWTVSSCSLRCVCIYHVID